MYIIKYIVHCIYIYISDEYTVDFPLMSNELQSGGRQHLLAIEKHLNQLMIHPSGHSSWADTETETAWDVSEDIRDSFPIKHNDFP